MAVGVGEKLDFNGNIFVETDQRKQYCSEALTLVTIMIMNLLLSRIFKLYVCVCATSLYWCLDKAK